MLGFMAGGLLAAWIGALWDVIMGKSKKIYSNKNKKI
jgi:hypothetical protein